MEYVIKNPKYLYIPRVYHLLSYILSLLHKKNNIDLPAKKYDYVDNAQHKREFCQAPNNAARLNV